MERDSKTLINHVPIGNGVIIRKTTRISGNAFKLAKNAKDIIERIIDETNSVVAYGSSTNTIELNDVVTLRPGAMFNEIEVKDNLNSLRTIYDKYRSNKSGIELLNNEAIPDELTIDTYLILDFYAISTIVK